MKGVIVYQSKYGATARYAKWLAEATGYEIRETKKTKAKDLKEYDVVILGGGIYASGIAGLSLLKKNYNELSSKEMIVFCVGASPYEEKAFSQVVEFNLKGDMANIPCFYCRGAWDFEGMHFTDRKLCQLLQKAVAKKDPQDYEVWEQALMEAGTQKCDWTDQAYLKPIIEAIQKVESEEPL